MSDEERTLRLHGILAGDLCAGATSPPADGYLGQPRDDQPWPRPIDPPDMIQRLATHVGGTIDECAALPDGSGFATMSFALPKSHWLYTDDGTYEPAPMPFWKGNASGRARTSGELQTIEDGLRAAARYAIRSSTMNGKEIDFDPDAMVQNFVTGALGYNTPDGLSSDEWANPPHLRGMRKDSAMHDGPTTNYPMQGQAPMVGASGPTLRTLSDESARKNAEVNKKPYPGDMHAACEASSPQPRNVRHAMLDRISMLRQRSALANVECERSQREADGLEALMNVLPLNLDQLSPLAANALFVLVANAR